MSDDTSDLIKKAFERAGGTDDPSIDRLLDAVPALQAKARARRAVAAPDTASARLVPKLALATAAITILAVLSIYSGGGVQERRATTLDSLILSGASSGEGDTLLDAVLSTDENDG